jgi:hypothetical protein
MANRLLAFVSPSRYGLSELMELFKEIVASLVRLLEFSIESGSPYKLVNWANEERDAP